MAKIQRAPELSFERYKKEFLPLVKPLFWILNKSFKNLTNALDGNLTYEDNFFSDARAVSGQTLAKIQSDGLTIKTSITSPKNIIVDVVKADGTIISAAGIKWENLGGGNIKITDISILKETGTVAIQTNVSDAIILNSAHRNNTTGNPHNITAAKLGLIGIIKSATITNTNRTLNLTLGDDTVLPFTPFSDDDNTKLEGIETGAEVNLFNSILGTAPISVSAVVDKAATISIVPATTSVPGSMSSADKTKLDGIEALAEVNPTDAETKTAYENNANTNAFTDSDETVVGRLPTGIWPNGNIMVGNGTDNAIFRNLDAATIPIQTFHYVEYDFTTGELVEKYAEDTEIITINPALDYQSGFIQNEFTLNVDGSLRYIG